MTLTTRVEKPPKLERLQNKIPDIKFDFLLLDFIRKIFELHEHSRTHIKYVLEQLSKQFGNSSRAVQEQLTCSSDTDSKFLKRIYDATTGES